MDHIAPQLASARAFILFWAGCLSQYVCFEFQNFNGSFHGTLKMVKNASIKALWHIPRPFLNNTPPLVDCSKHWESFFHYTYSKWRWEKGLSLTDLPTTLKKSEWCNVCSIYYDDYENLPIIIWGLYHCLLCVPVEGTALNATAQGQIIMGWMDKPLVWAICVLFNPVPAVMAA